MRSCGVWRLFRSERGSTPTSSTIGTAMIDLGATKLETPGFLAPLAGITDLPFRNLVTGFGAGLVVSEMIASQDMVIARAGSREKAELGLGFEKTAVQLAGREAFWMREAARVRSYAWRCCVWGQDKINPRLKHCFPSVKEIHFSTVIPSYYHSILSGKSHYPKYHPDVRDWNVWTPC